MAGPEPCNSAVTSRLVVQAALCLSPQAHLHSLASDDVEFVRVIKGTRLRLINQKLKLSKAISFLKTASLWQKEIVGMLLYTVLSIKRE
jgi:hypothetical protein